MMITIERLREISERCETGKPLDEDLAAWLGDCLRTFLDRGAETFEEAFGLPSCHGGVPWWKEERMRARDAALRLLARSLPEDMSLGARVREMNRLTVRYAASAWRIDRNDAAMPASYEETPRKYIWRAFASGAPMPLGERQLRNIVQGI